MHISTLIIATPLFLVGNVLGHGFVQQIKVGSNYFDTWNPYKDPQKGVIRPTRPFLDNGPIPDGLFDTNTVICNVAAKDKAENLPVNVTIPVPAGSDLTFLWTSWESDHPGPIMTYLAKCPSKCKDFAATSGNIWVKIHQEGYDATKSVPWASKRLYTQNSTWTVPIPQGLQNGEYILRHEILGLQRATEVGRAQFYPACHQITITGGGSVSLPTGIPIPGAYQENDPGILLQYRDISATKPYTPPGGPVWKP